MSLRLTDNTFHHRSFTSFLRLSLLIKVKNQIGQFSRKIELLLFFDWSSDSYNKSLLKNKLCLITIFSQQRIFSSQITWAWWQTFINDLRASYSINSFTGTFRLSAIAKMVARVGLRWPFSILFTVVNEMPALKATYSWVIDFFSRTVFNRFPNAVSFFS